MSLLTSLIYSYECDEASGNLLDAHGGHTLTDTNTVGATTGKISGARDFENTSSEYFIGTDSTDYEPGDADCAWDLWFNREDNAGYYWLFSKEDGNSGSNREYALLFHQDNGNMRFAAFADGHTETSMDIPSTSSFGTWYHLYIEYDATANKLGYRLDGGALTQTNHTGGFYQGTAKFLVGSRDDPSVRAPWDGLIDMLRFWKRKLTTDEQDELYNSGAGLAYSGFGSAPATYNSLLTLCGVG